MANMGILYRYELKKLLKRKLVWVTGIIILLLSVVVIVMDLTGNYYIDGVAVDTNYNMMKTSREYEKQLTGRAVDQEMLEEMKAAYSKVPMDVEDYTMTTEYQTYARPYSIIFNSVRQILKITQLKEVLSWDINETSLYDKRMEWIEAYWREMNLTEGEKAYWQEKEQLIQKPFVYEYAAGYWKLLADGQSLSILLILYAAICLSDYFSKEHTLRTDQMILSSRLGKKQLYWVKIMAGLSFLAVYYLLALFVVAMTVFGCYGLEGADAMMQIDVPIYSGTLRVGAVTFIMYALLCLAVLLTGIFVMMLSEVLHNGIVPLAIVSAAAMASIVIGGSENYRILSQIYAYLPFNTLNGRCMFMPYLVPLFGKYLELWQSAPIFWIVAAGVFLLIGRWFYQRYQVSGR